MIKRITESDINRIVKNVINESEDLVTGIAASKRTELVDDVINRINEHGISYIVELNKLNSKFPTQKYKRAERPRRDTFELPKGVRVQSSFFGEE